MKVRNGSVSVITLILSSVALVFAGCDSPERESVKSGIAGQYTLIEVEGNPIPATLSHGGVEMEVLEGSLSISADGACKSITRFKPVQGTEVRREVNATCTQDGNEVTMRWNGAGTTVGTMDGEKFTMNNEGMTFIYLKK